VLASFTVILLLIRGIPLVKVNFCSLRQHLAGAAILCRRLGVVAVLIQGIALLHRLVRGHCLARDGEIEGRQEDQKTL
jgi:hypothetical protein